MKIKPITKPTPTEKPLVGSTMKELKSILSRPPPDTNHVQRTTQQSNHYTKVPDIETVVKHNISMIVKFAYYKTNCRLMNIVADPHIYIDTSDTVYKMSRYTNEQILDMRRQEVIFRKRYDNQFDDMMEDLLSETTHKA